MIPLDLKGRKFGRLTPLEKGRAGPRGFATWRCLCDCGNETTTFQTNLVRGLTRSCGCLKRGNQNARIHGYRSGGQHGKTYAAWCSMRDRCNRPNHPGYKNWGGRGIRVCKRWVESFENFLQDMGDAPPGLTLDRKDNDGNYEPGNCRWATWRQQALNRRSKDQVALDDT